MEWGMVVQMHVWLCAGGAVVKAESLAPSLPIQLPVRPHKRILRALLARLLAPLLMYQQASSLCFLVIPCRLQSLWSLAST